MPFYNIFISFTIVSRVICDVSELNLGYVYPQPFPPVQFDEPSTPSNVYLPPAIQEEELPPVLIPPNPTYLTPTATYLPPNIYPPNNNPPEDDTVVIPALPGLYDTPPQVKILNMSCELDRKFKTAFKLPNRSLNLPPLVVEDGAEFCLTPGLDNSYFMDMEGKKMLACGVRRCNVGNSKVNMCVTIRIPTVRNIKLPEDGLVTLQCVPQDSVVAHTKHLRLGSNFISTKGRSNNLNNIVASGGGQRNFDTRMIVLRKSSGSVNFDEVVKSGSTVPLGEDLMLRASVKEGDGWQFMKMGSVIVRSSSTQKSLHLVDENGCRLAGVQHICSLPPRQLSPLVTLMPFRAFLFQGVSKDDMMLMSVRLIGCVRQQECYQSGLCDESRGRIKRNSKSLNGSRKNEEEIWDTEFQFMVSTKPNFGKSPKYSGTSLTNEFVVLAAMFGLLILAIVLIYIRKIIIY